MMNVHCSYLLYIFGNCGGTFRKHNFTLIQPKKCECFELFCFSIFWNETETLKNHEILNSTEWREAKKNVLTRFITAGYLMARLRKYR